MDESRKNQLLRFALDSMLVDLIPRARGDWKEGGFESELGPLDELEDDARKLLLEELR